MTTSGSKIIIKAPPVSKISVRNISLSREKTDKKVEIILDNGNEDTQLLFQTPYLEVSQGLVNTPYQNISQLETALRGDSEKNIEDFVKFIDQLEEITFGHVEKYGNDWFDTPNVQMKPLIRDTNGEKFIKWPIQLRPDTNIFCTQDGTTFDYRSLKVGDIVKFLVLIPGLWVNNNQFGYAIMVEKVRVKPFILKPIVEYDFEDFEDEASDDNNDLISALATECNTSTRKKLNLDKKRNDKPKLTNTQMTPLETIDDKTVIELLDTTAKRSKNKHVSHEARDVQKGGQKKGGETLDTSRSYDDMLTPKQFKANKKLEQAKFEAALALSSSSTDSDDEDENAYLQNERSQKFVRRYKE